METKRLEKIGQKVFDSFGELSSKIGDQTRIITPDEKRQLFHIQRNAIIKCALAGAVSALSSAYADLWAKQMFGSSLHYWLIFGGVTLVAAMLEILFIYHSSLKAVHSIAKTCDASLIKDYRNDEALTLSLVRAALEIPNPADSDQYIDPLKNTPRWRLIGISILYKVKVMASNVLAKIIARKLILRGATRAWLNFLAIPITALWNALVCYWITKQAIIRSLGPAYIEETLPTLIKNPEIHECAQRALACCITASGDIHPNHQYMLQRLRSMTDLIVKEAPASTEILLEKSQQLTKQDQQVITQVLSIAIMIDGKINKEELQLYQIYIEQHQNHSDTPKEHLKQAFGL